MQGLSGRGWLIKASEAEQKEFSKMSEFSVLKQKLPGVRRGVGIADWDCGSLRGGEGGGRMKISLLWHTFFLMNQET